MYIKIYMYEVILEENSERQNMVDINYRGQQEDSGYAGYQLAYEVKKLMYASSILYQFYLCLCCYVPFPS